MKRRNFLLTSALSAVLTLTVAACANSGGEASGEGGRKLVMVTSADYPPYEYVDSSSGSQEIVGFDVEIAEYITEELGYELEIQNIDFNGLIPALQANRADFVMAGMTPTEERKQNVDFSEIYYEAKNTIVTVKGSGLTTTESLNGKTVGVQLGSIQEGAAKEIEGANVKALNRISEMIQELKAGRVDALIMEDTVAEGYVANNSDLEFTEIATEGESGSAIAFPKGSELAAEFNPVLEEMKSSGKMEELVNKWFGEDSPAAGQETES
jgi:arginine/lysine/histidine transporter system substrate-binding protein